MKALTTDTVTWLLVATKPRSESLARLNLERQGYRVCLPQLSLRKRRHGRWQQIMEPMFPGYVFVGIVLGEQELATIRSTQGCREPVRFGGRFTPIPDAVVRDFLDADETPVEHKPTFRSGQQVRIEGGAFAGLEAVFEKSRGADRVQVLLSVLGSLRSVTIGEGDIAHTGNR